MTNNKVIQAAVVSMGLTGCTYINDTTVTNGHFLILQVIEDCTFTTLTKDADIGSDVVNIADIATDGLVAGTYFLPVSTITLATGKVLAYNR